MADRRSTKSIVIKGWHMDVDVDVDRSWYIDIDIDIDIDRGWHIDMDIDRYI